MARTVLELCAGGGGQALGLEQSGFECAAAAEIDHHSCETLRLNRPQWTVLEADIRELNGASYAGVDLIAGGVPCPPFSVAGKQLGRDDERDLFPDALRIISDARPRAVMLENVQGFSTGKFAEYRDWIRRELEEMGYSFSCRLLNASHFGVAQLRPRFLMVALQSDYAAGFRWPDEHPPITTVGETLADLMAANGWPGAFAWRNRANRIAPTIVGGSKKHGGPDLGPTRAKRQWRELGVDGLGIANEAPGPDFPLDGLPRLTTRMVARLQGFPDDWQFFGRKTAAYRQVGNAFPPPVAAAVSRCIVNALEGEETPIYRHDANGQLAFAREIYAVKNA
jgi:DNA (cytosine-5)-methyltransferase 1